MDKNTFLLIPILGSNQISRELQDELAAIFDHLVSGQKSLRVGSAIQRVEGLKASGVISKFEADVICLIIYVHSNLNGGRVLFISAKVKYLLGCINTVLQKIDYLELRRNKYKAELNLVKVRNDEFSTNSEQVAAEVGVNELRAKCRVLGSIILVEALWFFLNWERQWDFPKKFNNKSKHLISSREAIRRLEDFRFNLDPSAAAVRDGIEYLLSQYTRLGSVLLVNALASLDNGDESENSCALAWAYSVMPGYEAKALFHRKQFLQGKSKGCLLVCTEY
jgi:hypothetical protein